MKLRLLLASILGMLFINTYAQDKKVYTTTSGEIIFSFANITQNGGNPGSILRFSPVFNFQNYVNFDKSEHFGWFTGLTFRNVGFIYDESSTIRKKFRTYNLGIPIGIKLGNMNGKFLFAGYELELPINYKEKTIIDEKKDKFNTWFSNRTPTFMQSVFVGVQLPHGATIKFKYYLTNFFNKNYTDSQGSKPYNFDANVFYFALGFNILTDTDFTAGK